MPTVRLPPSEWYPAGEPEVAVRDVRLADGLAQRVLVAGPEGGRPVVLLHGWAISAYLWRHNIVPLARAGMRVFVPDLPGHGLSAVPTGRGALSLARCTDRLAMLLDALGLDTTDLAAQSMGGRIAIELVRRTPQRVRRLALFGPVGFGDLPPHKVFAPFVPLLPGTLPSLLVTRRAVELVQRRVHGKLKGGGFTERDVDEYWAPSQFPDVVRAQLQLLREFEWAPLSHDALKEVQTPTLVVFGTLDRTVRPAHAADLVARLPEGRLEWIEGGGHVVMEEVPQYVNALLRAFFDESGTTLAGGGGIE